MTPEELWTPAIGYLLHLSPRDIADLSAKQWLEVGKFIDDYRKDNRSSG